MIGEDVSLVRINESRVQALARRIAELPLAKDFAAKSVPQVEASDETLFSACLWAAAICHNTKGGLTGTIDGSFYNGWDYLLRAFITAAVNAPTTVTPNAVCAITGDG